MNKDHYSLYSLLVPPPRKLLELTINLTISSLVDIYRQFDLNPPQLANQSALATLHLKKEMAAIF